MGFETALIEEIAVLERELEADPRFQKLRALQTALAYYQPGAFDGTLTFHQNVTPHSTALHQSNAAECDAVKQVTLTRRYALGRRYAKQMKRKAGRQRDPERQRALDEAVKFVQDHGGMPTTAEVYAHLTGLGITIGGQSPQGNLSAMLYKDGRLTSHGRAGWTFGPPLTDKTESEKASGENEPSDVSPSDGSDAGSDEERPEALYPTYPFHPAS